MAQIFQPNGTGSAATSAGSKNYLSTYNGNPGNGDFELGNTNGWALGTVTLTSNLPTGVPTFGSGASGNLSLSAVSSGQLAATSSGSVASSAATTAGDFIASSAFTIDIEDQAKVMTFKFYYKAQTNPSNGNWSGTTSNSFGVAIYDVTNSAWIIPAGIWSMTQSSGVGYATGTFQTTSNSTSYRLVVYNANATSGAITLYYDDLFVGPQTAPFGPPITDWGNIPWTPTGAWSTNSTYTGFYKRVGDTFQGYAHIALAGAPTAASLTINLPTGLTADTTKIPAIHAGIAPAIGFGSGKSAGVASIFEVQYNSTTSVSVVYQSSTVAAATSVDATHPGTFASNDYVDVYFTLPIVGWSSNVQMSSDTDTRVVAMQVQQSTPTATVAGSFSLLKFTSGVSQDTHGGFSTSTGLYTCPVTGFYRVTAAVSVSATFVNTNSVSIGISKNSTTTTTLATSAVAGAAEGTLFPIISGTIFCNSGDTLAPLVASNGTTPTIASNNVTNFFQVERLSGPSIVAATESVNARYFASATTISGSLATVSWTTKDFDSHLGMSSGTYTIATTGKYQINSAVATTGTFALNNTVVIEIQKNGTVVTRVKNFAGGIVTDLTGEIGDIISCVSGDTIRIQLSSSATTPTIISSNFENYFSICRVGN